jgi:hypothetical protein
MASKSTWFTRIYSISPNVQIGDRLIVGASAGMNYNNIYDIGVNIGFERNTEYGASIEFLILKDENRWINLSLYSSYLYGYNEEIYSLEEYRDQSIIVDVGFSLFKSFPLFEGFSVTPSLDLVYFYEKREAIPAPIETGVGDGYISYVLGGAIIYKRIFVNSNWLFIPDPNIFSNYIHSFSLGVGVII